MSARRTRDELLEYARDLGGTRDYALSASLARLLAGDEAGRDVVEEVLDQIDDDLARVAARHGGAEQP